MFGGEDFRINATLLAGSAGQALEQRPGRVATRDGFVLDDDGEAYEISSPYTLAQARNLSYSQSADVLFLSVHGVRPTRLMRHGHANWEFEAMTFTSPLTGRPDTQEAE